MGSLKCSELAFEERGWPVIQALKEVLESSPHLDTPSSRYEFLKFAFKYVKINQENISNTDWQLGPTGQQDPHVSDT